MVVSRPSGELKAGVDYPRNFIEFEECFPDEEAAYRYLERLRWPEGFRCPRCAETTTAWRSGRGLLICPACRRQVSVTAGTLFEKTRKPLRSWLHVAWEITNAKQGVNALTLQHRLGLRSYQTAWSWLHSFGVYPDFPTPFWGLSGFCVGDSMGKSLWKLVENTQRFPRRGGRVLCVHGAVSFHRARPCATR